MATGGDPVYTTETSLGLRLMALITDEGTPVLRKLFNWEVSRMTPRGKSLQEHLQDHKGNLFDLLNSDQQKIVYPSTGVANSSKDFDISLLCLLLERLCKTDHMALIHQLRKFRNKNHGHITNTALSKGKFDQLWKELSEVLLGLGRVVNNVAENRDLESRITKRKVLSIEPEHAQKYQTKFEVFYRQDNKLKDLIVAHGEKMWSLIQEEHRLSQRERIKINNLLSKIRKERRHSETTQGKQHTKLLKKLDELEKMLKAIKDAGQHTDTDSTVVPQRTSAHRPHLIKQCMCHQTGDSEGMPPTIKKLRKSLQRWYRSQLRRLTPLPWCEDLYLDVEQMFTTLQMVGWDGIKEDCMVEAENMFQPHKSIVPKTIRVEGDPGIGKTTLCYKIVYDCSAKKSKFDVNNKFSSFKLVLYVEMRKVPHDATDAKSTIFQQVFSEAFNEYEEEFWKYVKCNPEDVLFVLDGLDEMPEETRQKLKIAQFIRGQIIQDVHVIVTSRPYLCNQQLASCDRHLIIKGYSHENIECYINRNPKLDSSSKEGLLKQLTENESLHQLTENPLNLALLCVMWQEDWNDAVLPQTLTGLYSILVLAIIKRYAKKCPGISDASDLSLEEMPEPIQVKVDLLKKLAWKGIEEDRLHFSGKELDEGVVKMGFLTKDLNLTTLIQQSFCFQFLHKTFQEYFAAKHLLSLCAKTGKQSSKATNVLMECVQHEKYQQVLKFLAGLLGTNADCLFEAFHDSLSTKQDETFERVVSLCLECLHECGAGTELVRYVGDVLPRDWSVGFIIEDIDEDDQNSAGKCVLSCKTNMSSHEEMVGERIWQSNEALYGLVHLLNHLAQQHSEQDNPQLSNVYFRVGLQHATCRFLRAVSSMKVFSFLSVESDILVINEASNLLLSDAYKDLTCDFSIYSSVHLEGTLNPTNQDAFSGAIEKVIRLGSMTREGGASVELQINCADDIYVPGFASSSLSCIVTATKQSQIESSHSQGNLRLHFSVNNLPLAEKPAVQSQLADLSAILEDSTCIFRVLKFVCICEDGSFVSTGTTGQHLNMLLQSLTVNQSLTEVSFLCDGPENVVECLCNVFAKNRTLQKLEIGFFHPVDDETMANIFSSYPVDSQSHIKSFSVSIKTRLDPSLTDTTVSNCHSYEQTIRAILYICKNLGEGCALQRISFISSCRNIMMNTVDIMMRIKEALGKVSQVTPVCPSSLLKPLVEAIVDSQLLVNLGGIIWEGVTDLHVTDEERTKYDNSDTLRRSQLGYSDTGVSIKQLLGFKD
ncbi:uncharacterized protein LOC144883080 [Branchiostoma floridae x Branchiostoma japonicum]